MADDDQSQKTEEPSQKRLGEAQAKGQVVESQEVSHWFSLALLLPAMVWGGNWKYPAGIALMVNALLLTHNLWRAWLRYRAALARAA